MRQIVEDSIAVAQSSDSFVDKKSNLRMVPTGWFVAVKKVCNAWLAIGPLHNLEANAIKEASKYAKKHGLL